jgi:hypothetical protein
MKNRFRQFLLVLAAVMIAAFTWMPPAHQIPDNNRFVPEVVYELPPVATFTLTASDVVAPKGSEVCIEVKTSDFNQILSMQYSMNWDAKILKFKEVRSYGLPGLTKNNFGQHLTEKGILTFSWYDPNLRGMTKNGEVKFYEVCFEATGEPGSKAQFYINSNPTVIEITNSAGVFLDLRTQGGAVEVKAN